MPVSGLPRRSSALSWKHQPSGRHRWPLPLGPAGGPDREHQVVPQARSLLDITESTALDYYLLTGPPSAAASSRGTTRPWCIEAVFLFDARQLRSEENMRGS